MKLEIKNSMISPAIKLLYDLKLKGKQSRHRTKFIKQLQGKMKELHTQELDLIKEYAGDDGDGGPKKREDGSFAIRPEDESAFRKEQDELFEEPFVIDGGDNYVTLETVKDIVLEYDEEVSGDTAVAYDYLCEAFENMKD
ncbi:Protein of unknown function [Terribacillus aidingensis]|uniref:Uncharacterized protein n=1 Tax=Terribacillus aidingensis TaxID=586416 RepID=A0A285P312_9BACI|nr:DUF1617 family protein [Terribacillus aidingensis]SNZ14546.1 Protein of unknown function [Terribacillus aidingensis]